MIMRKRKFAICVMTFSFCAYCICSGLMTHRGQLNIYFLIIEKKNRAYSGADCSFLNPELFIFGYKHQTLE